MNTRQFPIGKSAFLCFAEDLAARKEESARCTRSARYRYGERSANSYLSFLVVAKNAGKSVAVFGAAAQDVKQAALSFNHKKRENYLREARY